MVPLAYIKKGPLREFDARGADGSVMPVLGTPDTTRYGVAMARSELARTNSRVSQDVIDLVEEIVGPDTNERAREQVEGLLKDGVWRGHKRVDPMVFDGNDAADLLRTLAGRFLLIGLVDAQSAGSRQVLKFSYDWHVEGLPPRHFRPSLLVAFGWKSRTLEVPLEAASAAASCHLEFQTPPEARCRLLRLPGDTGEPGLFDDSRKPVAHVHAHYTQQPDEDGELFVDLPFRGMRVTATVAAAFVFVVMLLALVLPGAHAVWWLCSTQERSERMNDSSNKRIEVARGNSVPGGKISSLGARGASGMAHSSKSPVQSNGRTSWVGKSRFAG